MNLNQEIEPLSINLGQVELNRTRQTKTKDTLDVKNDPIDLEEVERHLHEILTNSDFPVRDQDKPMSDEQNAQPNNPGDLSPAVVSKLDSIKRILTAIDEGKPIPQGVFFPGMSADESNHLHDYLAHKRGLRSQLQLPHLLGLDELEEILSTRSHSSLFALADYSTPGSALFAVGRYVEAVIEWSFYLKHNEEADCDTRQKLQSSGLSEESLDDKLDTIFQVTNDIVTIDRVEVDESNPQTTKVTLFGWRKNARGHFENDQTTFILTKQPDGWKIASAFSSDTPDTSEIKQTLEIEGDLSE